jgi:molybdopterin synthase catalytic subunit
MDLVVKFFATYREITGLSEARLEMPPDATVAALLDRLFGIYPSLAAHRQTMVVAVNQQFAEPESVLRPGDEVALLPPVSGGVDRCRVQREPIDPEEVLALVRDPAAGAVVLFLGTVRADPGVKALDYEAYEGMAVKELEALRSAAKERFGVTEVAVAHRTGRLAVGETSVAIACSAPHREAAFRACAWAIEKLKKIVPVWKTERD